RTTARPRSQMNTQVHWMWRLHAIGAAVTLPLFLEHTSLEWLERQIRLHTDRRFRHAPDDRVAARWVEDVLTGRPHPWANSCLRRSIVLYYLLRRAGRDVELCIGVRRDEEHELKAHAWLVLDGAAYVEPFATRELVGSFGEIARFPSRRVAA